MISTMKILYSLYQYDLRMLLWCSQTSREKQLIQLAKSLSKTGDGYLQILLPVIFLLMDKQQGWQFFITVAVAFTFQMPIYWVLKNQFKRNRPQQAIPSFKSCITAADEFSFPSGHSSAAFLMASITVLFYGSTALPLYLWAALVSVSRVVLGVHFPTDIIAGISLSLLTTALVVHYAIPLIN